MPQFICPSEEGIEFVYYYEDQFRVSDWMVDSQIKILQVTTFPYDQNSIRSFTLP
jgi:hypothetical protein